MEQNDDIISGFPFPSADVDPNEKGYDYIQKYLKAAWSSMRGYLGNNLYFGASRYREIRRYGMGKQSINKYKRVYGIDEQTNETFMTIDWTPTAIASKYREIAISLIAQKLYDFEIDAIDSQSKVEQDNYFNALYVKMLMRKAAQQMNSPLQNTPLIKKGSGEPDDEEELDMQKDYTYKHNLAMKLELGCSYIHDLNDVEEQRLRTSANLFDYGIGGYRDWIDEQGLARYRAVDPDNWVCSSCSLSDFSDMQHCGEVIEVLLVDLAPWFTKEQLKIIAKTACRQYGNPSSYSEISTASNYYGNFKVHVWDAVFYSYNTSVYRAEIKNGNLRMANTDWQNSRKSMADRTIDYQGTQIPEFMSAKRKVVYKGKWIVGTDYMYDWGLMENQKRNAETWWDTRLPYRMYAWNFDKMNFTGITERMIPVVDDWHKTQYKLQDIKNKLIPYIMNINLSALEAAGFGGKGGKKMTPMEQIDFLTQNYAAVFRETDLLKGQGSGGKAAWFELTGQMEIIMQYRTELQNIEHLFMSITGLNDVTNGNTPDPRNLTPNIEAAMSSTNNCLYLVARAEKKLYQGNTQSIIDNIQLSVQKNDMEGYVRAIGANAIQYFKLSADVATRKFGLFVRDAPTPAERQAFIQDINLKDANGLIDPTDKVMLMNVRNLKEGAEILAYKIKKRREQAQQDQIQQQQATAQANAQGAMQLEQMKQQTQQLQLQGQLQVANAQGYWVYVTEQFKKGSDLNEAQVQANAKMISASIMASAKGDGSTGIPQQLPPPPPIQSAPMPQSVPPPQLQQQSMQPQPSQINQ